MEPAAELVGTRKLQRQLDDMRRAAGHVRDIDVEVELLEKFNAGDYGNDCQELRSALLRRRDRLEKKAAKQVKRELNRQLEDRLEKIASAMEQAKPQKKTVSIERLQTVREQYIEFTSEVPQDGDPLHDLRKAIKRLRYRAEAIPGRESRALEKSLKTVQRSIGDWHDWSMLAMEAEKRLEQRSIAFVAFLRSQSIGKRHDARREILALRQKLIQTKAGKKGPARAEITARSQKMTG